MNPDEFGLFDSVFMLAIGLFLVLIVAGVVFTVYAAARRKRALERAGLDPYAADIQVMAKMANSSMLAPQQNLAARLAELDDLRGQGIISEEEHAKARAAALGTE